MQLERLYVDGSFSDLSPLRSMPLKTLDVVSTKVVDFSALTELPLRELFLEYCTEATDVAPLAKISSLELLVLPRSALNFDLLQSHPKLSRIGFRFDGSWPTWRSSKDCHSSTWASTTPRSPISRRSPACPLRDSAWPVVRECSMFRRSRKSKDSLI